MLIVAASVAGFAGISMLVSFLCLMNAVAYVILEFICVKYLYTSMHSLLEVEVSKRASDFFDHLPIADEQKMDR